jgi:hypothetical protein
MKVLKKYIIRRVDMKIRNGFVSNSSTSSFVIVGFKLPSKKVAKSLYEKYPDDVYKDSYNQEYTFGKVLLDVDDTKELDMVKFEKLLQEIKEEVATVWKETDSKQRIKIIATISDGDSGLNNYYPEDDEEEEEDED